MPVHRTNNETTKPGAGQPSQYVSASSSSELPNIKYVKTAAVNQKSYDALVDTGSSVRTIKAPDAMGCCSCFEEDNLELYGFGQSPVKCLSRFRTAIEIDGVKGEDVMLHVVPGTAQHFSVIIGRTWTELPNITYVKVDDTFKIMDTRDDTFRHLEPFTQTQALKITRKNDIALEPRSVNFILASVDLESVTDVLYQRNGTMTGSVFHVASKQLSVPAANTSNCEKILTKGMSLGRVEEVNMDTAKLSTTSETTEVKTATADSIHAKDVTTGNDVTTKERQDLLKLLIQHRECFATNIEALGCTNLIGMDVALKEGSSKMEHVDAMSRAAVEDPSDPWDNVIADKLDMWMKISLHDQALISQRSDEEIRRIDTILEKKSFDRTAEERALAQNFVLKEGRLFRETEVNGKKKLLYVMPKPMRKSLRVKFHDLEGTSGLIGQSQRSAKPTGSQGCADGNDQRELDIGLKGVETFLNTSYNKSTGRTPFEVLYGYNPKFHNGAWREIAEKEDNPGRIQNNFKLKCERVY
ncbi:hypothetical protein V5799_011775 [Amblyomma americanum]|uniref:Uncharacterized protein n=1 Tax=Amblyomma americanum TaxID=6943 RepID=A0AAQ4EG84_AMBAM